MTESKVENIYFRDFTDTFYNINQIISVCVKIGGFSGIYIHIEMSNGVRIFLEREEVIKEFINMPINKRIKDRYNETLKEKQ